MSFVEVTLADGRRMAVPKFSARVIEEVEPPVNFPDAKTFILYALDAGMATAFLKDSFPQLMRLLPKAQGGAAWIDFKKEDGRSLSVMDGSIVHWEQAHADNESAFIVRCKVRMDVMDQYDIFSTFEDMRRLTHTDEGDDNDGREEGSDGAGSTGDGGSGGRVPSQPGAGAAESQDGGSEAGREDA